MLKKKNFSKSVLASGIVAGASQLTVAAGEGTKFPSGGKFRAVLWTAGANPSADPNAEVVEARLSAGDVFDLWRGKEGTAARAWSASDNFAHVLTAGTVEEIEAAVEANALDVMLNAFRIAVVGSLSVQKMADGVVDEFEDETGVDTAASTNESYDGTNDLYSPLNAGDEKLAGTVQSDNQIGVNQTVADRSFALDNGKTVKRLGLNQAQAVTGTLKILKRTAANTYDVAAEKAISHGGTGWEWVTLDAPFDVPGTGDYHVAFYLITGSTNTHTTGGYARSYMSGEASGTGNTMTEDTGTVWPCGAYYAVQDMSLHSNAQAAEVQPGSARLVVFEEDVDSIAENTDLKAWASRDGGTTWTQIILADEGDYAAGKRILAGTADISAQPAGASMKWKLSTHNYKNLKIHGVSLSWA